MSKIKFITAATALMASITLVTACGGGDEGGTGGGGGGTEGGDGKPLPVYASSRNLAFPGADGCGAKATGGAGGTVYHVTSLNDADTEGTLRHAINQYGKRIIVFDVSGTISLNDKLTIRNGDVTIAGQSAPGDGICLKNYTLTVDANNVVIRYMRFRMGDVCKTEDDALNSCHDNATRRKNIIIDHCSLSWCTDECGSFYGNENFTLQWCILSESLNNSVHLKGAHGYGGIWGGKDATFHHNLLAHHKSRMPRFDHDYVSTVKGTIDYVNNVVYNWGDNNTYGGESSKGAAARSINMVNNYYKPGPASSKNKNQFFNLTNNCGNCVKENVPAKVFLSGNTMEGNSDITADNWKGVRPDVSVSESVYRNATAFVPAQGVAFTEKAADAFNSVVQYAGASFVRDAVDTRICKETKEGTFTYKGTNGSNNGLIDSQQDVGGWPSLKDTGKKADSDGDGMPDEWERTQLQKLGCTSISIQDFKPEAYNLTGKYTNLEVYLNELVTATFPAGAKANETR